MPKLIKSFTSVSGSVVNPTRFRSAIPARAKLVSIPTADDDETMSVVFPFGPQDLDHSNLAGKSVEIQRPGRKPLLFHENQQLRTVSFKAVVADKASGGTLSIEDTLDKLETLAATAVPCSFIYGLTALSYTVAITKLSFEVTYRNSSGEPLRAEVDVQLTETPSFSQELAVLKAVLNNAGGSTSSYTKSFGSVTGSGTSTSTSTNFSTDANRNISGIESFTTAGRTFYNNTASLAEHAAYVAEIGDVPRDYTPEVTQSAIEAAVAAYEPYQPPPPSTSSTSSSTYPYIAPLSSYTAVYTAPSTGGGGGGSSTYL